MWWLALACSTEECPAGFVPSDKGCVRPDQQTAVVREPLLVVDPPLLDLGTVDFTCATAGDLEVRNDGDAELDVATITFTSQLGHLTLDEDTLPPLPHRLEPGDSFALRVDFTAEGAGADLGTLSVTTTTNPEPVSSQVTGVVSDGEERLESFVAPLPIADILLLVDTSCSMYEDNIDDVQLGIPAMLTALDEAADWQLAVISRANGCTNVPFVSDASPASAQAVVDNVFVTSGFNPYAESLFALANQALTQLAGCNAGMLRPGGQLHFIVVSDEYEQSGVEWQTWVNQFQSYAGTFVVSAVVDVNSSCGDGTGPTGYLEAATVTGGPVLDVCEPSWGTGLTEVVDAIEAGVVAPVTLAEVPMEESIVVEVNGVVADAFTYNALENTVQNILPPPAPGDTIDVRYLLPVTCD